MDLIAEHCFEKSGMSFTSTMSETEYVYSAIIEPNIYIKGYEKLKFYFSDDFEKLLNIYIEQTGGSVYFKEKIEWTFVERPNKDIKNLFGRYKVKYSMTYYMEEEYRTIIFNKHVNNKLYFTYYSVKQTGPSPIFWTDN